MSEDMVRKTIRATMEISVPCHSKTVTGMGMEIMPKTEEENHLLKMVEESLRREIHIRPDDLKISIFAILEDGK